MGCTGSTNALPAPLKMANGIPNGDLPSPVAFVVPLNEEEESLIKKHPPKRFQRLEEQQTTPPPLTHKMLQDKLAEAEQRRLQILNERIESAKVLMRPKCVNGNGKLVNGMFDLLIHDARTKTSRFARYRHLHHGRAIRRVQGVPRCLRFDFEELQLENT